MTWRPRGLRNPYNIQIIEPVPKGADPTAFTAWEACAEAIIKDLLNSPDCFYTNSAQIADFCKKHKGWLVFIPDEKGA